MRSLNQINASRINGAKSQGPVSPEGKARVSQNGTTHGIYSKLVVLNNEDHSMYIELRESHLRVWAPANEAEHDLVIDIVDARWKLRRFQTFETAALDFEVHRLAREIDATFEEIDEEMRTMLSFNSLLISNRTFDVLQNAIRQQYRIIDRTLSQLLRLRKLRNAGALNPEIPGLDSGTGPRSPEASSDLPQSPESAPEPAPTTPRSDHQDAKSENSGSKPEPRSLTRTPDPQSASVTAVRPHPTGTTEQKTPPKTMTAAA